MSIGENHLLLIICIRAEDDMTQSQEYWKWPEKSWSEKGAVWPEAEKLTAGIDVGTTSTQAAVFADGRLVAYASIATGWDFKTAPERALAAALEGSGLDASGIGSVAATGFGAEHVKGACKRIDEVTCHAKGGRFIYGPSVSTIVDIGGQTVKAIRLYDWDRVRDFTMNDKCATGMGRSIELMCDILGVPIEEAGETSLKADKDPEPVSHTCYSFANPEVVGLFRQGFKEDSYSENDVCAAWLFAVAWRVIGTIAKLQPLDAGDVKVYGPIGFTGGLALNSGVTKRIERELKSEALTSDIDPMLAGAIGAALLA